LYHNTTHNTPIFLSLEFSLRTTVNLHPAEKWDDELHQSQMRFPRSQKQAVSSFWRKGIQ
jgi:hypothetical protein